MFNFDEEFYKKILEFKDVEWTPSLNLFSGLLFDEIKKLAGYKPGPKMLTLKEREEVAKENYSICKNKVATVGKTYPDSFNWLEVGGKKKDYMTPIKNQGFCSSCSAFSSIAAVETMIKIKNIKANPNLSEAQLFFKSPGFSKEDTEDTHNCKTGMQVDKALDYLVNTGVVPDSMYPYDLEDKFQDLPKGWESKTTKITGYTKLNRHGDMKSWIATKGPLITAMTVNADFIFYGKGIYSHVAGPVLGMHGVCVVGYNDDYQAWLCKNSWSNNWGENGYFWVKYGQCGIGSEMWAIEGVKAYSGEE